MISLQKTVTLISFLSQTVEFFQKGSVTEQNILNFSAFKTITKFLYITQSVNVKMTILLLPFFFTKLFKFFITHIKSSYIIE